MYIKDGEPYSYDLRGKELVGVTSIGWLARGYEFPRGPVTVEFVTALKRITLNCNLNEVGATRGLHPCDFCNQEPIAIDGDRRFGTLGHAEIWVPSVDGQEIFAAPNLIFHYITAHQYKPSDNFVKAILHFNLESDWDGEKIRDQLIQALRNK